MSNEAIKKELEQTTTDLRTAAAALETIANSLYHATERKDRDMTKPAAVCVEFVKKIVEDCLNTTQGIEWEIERSEKGRA